MKKIITLVVTLLIGLITGGVSINYYKMGEINQLKADIINCQKTNIGLNVSAQGNGNGNVTGLSVTSNGGTGLKIDMNNK